MKCYVLYAKAISRDIGRIITSEVLKVFANEELGENYIHETWPEAQYRCDDDYGKHWELSPNEYFKWYGIYQLLEMEIEGL